MDRQSYTGTQSQNEGFWDHAGMYASSTDHDRSFTTEMAYIIVTLYRTGA